MKQSSVVLLLGGLSLLATSCATSPREAESANVARAKARLEVTHLQKALRRQTLLVEELRERNTVLEKRLSIAPMTSSAPMIEKRREEEKAEGHTSGDQLLYAKVLEAYRRHDSAEMRRALDGLLQSAADSIHADNALYMAALLAFEQRDQARTLELLNRVLRDYPRGNKVVSALFLRSVVYRQMNEPRKSKRDLELVAKTYPGSPEAARVRWELKRFELPEKKTASSTEKSEETLK